MDEMPTCPIFTEDQPDFNPPGPPTKSCRKTVKCCVQMTMLVRKMSEREKRDGDKEEKTGVHFDMVYFPPSETNEGKAGKARRGRSQKAGKLERSKRKLVRFSNRICGSCKNYPFYLLKWVLAN